MQRERKTKTQPFESPRRINRGRWNYGDGEGLIALDSVAVGSVVPDPVVISDEAVGVGLASRVIVSFLCFARSRTR